MITENESLAGATRVRSVDDVETVGTAGTERRVVEPERRPDARSLGDVIAEAQTDVSNIVRKEIQLAKAELKVDVANAGKGAGMFGAAAFLALFGLQFLLFTLAWLLDNFMPRTAAFGIVTLILFAGAGILALVGKKAISKVNPKPERTIRNAQETVATVKDSAKQGKAAS